MSQPAVKWKDILHYFNDANDYRIHRSGGDAIIIKLPTDRKKRKKLPVRIGHKFSNHPGCEIPRGLLGVIQRRFGVSREDILNAR